MIHDTISVSDASVQLDILMRRPQMYNWWKLLLIGGMCSTSICTVSFGGSFLDALIVFPLGSSLVGIQLLSVRNELYSHVFEYAAQCSLLYFQGLIFSQSQGYNHHSFQLSRCCASFYKPFLLCCYSIQLCCTHPSSQLGIPVIILRALT